MSQLQLKVAYFAAMIGFLYADAWLAWDMSNSISSLIFLFSVNIALAFGGTALFGRNIFITLFFTLVIVIDIFHVCGGYSIIVNEYSENSVAQKREDEILSLKKDALNSFKNLNVNLAEQNKRISELRVKLAENNAISCQDKECKRERKNKSSVIQAEIENVKSNIDLVNQKNNAIDEVQKTYAKETSDDIKKQHPYYRMVNKSLNNIGINMSPKESQIWEINIESIALVIVLFVTSYLMNKDNPDEPTGNKTKRKWYADMVDNMKSQGIVRDNAKTDLKQSPVVAKKTGTEILWFQILQQTTLQMKE